MERDAQLVSHENRFFNAANNKILYSFAGRQNHKPNKLFVEPVSVPDLEHTAVHTSLLGDTDQVSHAVFACGWWGRWVGYRMARSCEHSFYSQLVCHCMFYAEFLLPKRTQTTRHPRDTTQADPVRERVTCLPARNHPPSPLAREITEQIQNSG